MKDHFTPIRIVCLYDIVFGHRKASSWLKSFIEVQIPNCKWLWEEMLYYCMHVCFVSCYCVFIEKMTTLSLSLTFSVLEFSPWDKCSSPFPESRHVVTGDGNPKMIFSVNGSMPGPPLVVYEGQQVGSSILFQYEDSFQLKLLYRKRHISRDT